jgi:hypothetical protein
MGHDSSEDTTETKIVAGTGTVFVGYKDGEAWIGLSEESDPQGGPALRICLTDMQIAALATELSYLR